MKAHRFIFIFFIVGLVVYCISNFLLQKNFDRTIIAGAFIYLLGIVVSYLGYQYTKNKKKGNDLLDSLP
jgi:hypothetical protein